MKYLLCVFTAFCFLGLQGQEVSWIGDEYYSISSPIYSDSPEETIEFVLPTSDDGYLLVGHYLWGSGDIDGLIIKVNSSGQEDWRKTDGDGGDDYFRSAVEVNGFYFIVGSIETEINPGVWSSDLWVSKYPIDGSTATADNVVYFDGSGDAFVGVTIEETFGGNIVVGGSIVNSTPGAGFTLAPTTGGFIKLISSSSFGNHNPSIRGFGTIVLKIEQTTNQSYWIFGEEYNASDENCFDDQVYTISTGTETFTSGYYSDVFAQKLNNSFSTITSRIGIGGQTSETYIDGIATTDGGFAILGYTDCESNSGNSGPNNICVQGGGFTPYWIYNSTSQGSYEWVDQIDGNPFGIIEGCINDEIIFGTIPYAFEGGYLIDLSKTSSSLNYPEYLGNSPTFGSYLPKVNDIKRGFDNEIVLGGNFYNSNQDNEDLAFFRFTGESSCIDCFRTLPACLEGLIPPCEEDCYCVEPSSSDLPLPFQCETFNSYTTNMALSSQSDQWSLEAGQADAVVSQDGEVDILLHLAPVEGTNPGVLYHLKDGNGDNLTCGRYRASWQMQIDTDNSAGFRVLFDQNEDVNSDNISAQVYFIGGNAVIQVWDEESNFGEVVSIPFSYTQGLWINPMFIIDLDEGKLEFWLNSTLISASDYNFNLAGNFSSGTLGAITFFGDENADYLIDNICIRAAQTPNCSTDIDQVCVQNGNQYDNECIAAQAGLYTGDELEVCLSVCDFGGEFIGRNDQQLILNSLETYEQAPNLTYSNPDIIDDFDGIFPLYTDIYVFENEENGIINIDFNGGSNNIAYVYRCTESGSEYIAPANEIRGDPQVAGFYYILVVSQSPVDEYGISVSPSSPCEIQSETLTCGSSINSDFSGSFTGYQHENSIDGCYNGTNAYDSEGKVYRLEIAQASVVDIELNATGGAAAIFLYGSNCGNTCIDYAESSFYGGLATIENTTLANGYYYLVVFEKNPSSSVSFSLDINCAEDTNNSVLTVFSIADCEENYDSIHTVGIDFSLINDSELAPNDVFSIRIKPPVESNIPYPIAPDINLVYQGQTAGTFPPLPLYIGSDLDRCSFLEGDTIALFLAQGENETRECRAVFRSSSSPGIDAENIFNPNSQSEIINYVLESPGIAINISPTTFKSFNSDNSNDAFTIFVNNQHEWDAVNSDSWIHFDQQGPFNGYHTLNIQVDENEGFEERTGQVIIQTTEYPIVSKTITIKQDAPCIPPVVSFPGIINQTIEICEGESVTITAETNTAPNSIYHFFWNDGTTEEGNSKTIPPLSVGTHTYPLTVQQRGCPSALIETAITINVYARPEPIELNGTDLNSCSGENTFMIQQPEDGMTYTWRNTNGSEAGSGPSFTPTDSGSYFVYGYNPGHPECTSETVSISYTVIETLVASNTTINNDVCLGDEIALSVSTNLPTDILNFSWDHNITQNAASATYLPQEAGPDTIDVEVQNGDCPIQVIEIPIHVIDIPQTPQLNAINLNNCSGDNTFVINQTEEGVAYIWQNADGVQVSDQSFFPPTDPGSYTVYAYNTNHAECTSEAVNISYTVIETLVASNVTANNDVCLGDEIVLSVSTNLPVDNLNFNWDHNITQNAASVTYLPQEAGLDTIDVEIQNGDCPTEIIEIPIHVIAIPQTPNVTDVAYCDDDPGTISLEVTNSSDDQTINWYTTQGGNTPISSENPYTPGYSGTFWVEIASSTCFSQSVSVENTIDESFTLNLMGDEEICVGNSAIISANTSITSNNLNFDWSNNVNGSGDDVSFFGANEGSYSIDLTASNGTCVETANLNIEVGAFNVPDPIINTPDIILCPGDSIPSSLLVSTTDPDRYTVYWYNSPETNASPISTGLEFLNPTIGTYYVEAVDVNVNICTSDRFPINISQVSEITSSISIIDNPGLIACEGSEVILFVSAEGGSGSNNLRYRWDDGLSQGAILSINIAAGLQTHTVTITDINNNCQKVNSITVQGIPLPTYSVISNPTCINNGDQYTMTINTDATTDEISMSTLNGSITPLGNGDYQFTVDAEINFDIMIGSGEGDIICDPLIKPILAPDCSCPSIAQAVAIAATVDICINDSEDGLLEVEDPAGNLIVKWYDNSDLTGDPLEQGLTYETSEAGTYYAIVEDPTNNNCRSSFPTPITLVVNDLPIVDAGDDEVVCFGDLVQLDASEGSSGALPLTYQWTPNTFLSEDNIASPILTATEEMTSLVLIITDDNNCSHFDQLQIQTTSLPEAGITVNQNILCFGDLGQLEATYSGEYPLSTLLWSTNSGNTIIDQLPPDLYTLTVIDENGCEDEESVQLNEPDPFIELNVINDAIIHDVELTTPGVLGIVLSGGTPPYTYTWMDENNDIVGGNNPIYQSTQEGTYYLSIVDENDCSFNYTFNLITSLSELTDIGTLNLFPNPTYNSVILEVDLFSSANMELLLLDGLGQRIKTAIHPNVRQNRFDLDIHNLAAGVYWLQIKIGATIINKKIIKID